MRTRASPLTRYRIDLVARDCDFSITRAGTELGYEPRVGLDEAVARTAAWWKELRV